MRETAFIYWIVCYLVGNSMTAYLMGKLHHIDLQMHHSGNLGARNAGRVLGRAAFVMTFLGDALKGAIVIFVGRWIGFEQWILAIGLFFVIIGHLYPFWLKFRGGKGVATFIGAGLCLEPGLFVWMIVGTLLLYLAARDLSVAMLGGFFLYIASMVWVGKLGAYGAVILAICLIVWKHRINISQKE